MLLRRWCVGTSAGVTVAAASVSPLRLRPTFLLAVGVGEAGVAFELGECFFALGDEDDSRPREARLLIAVVGRELARTGDFTSSTLSVSA